MQENTMNTRDFINEYADGAVLFDACDSALIGYGSRVDMEPVAIYSYRLLVQSFIEQGMDEDDASEYVEYNIVGLWAGERTPIIVYEP
jgi:hypothetical protein